MSSMHTVQVSFSFKIVKVSIKRTFHLPTAHFHIQCLIRVRLILYRQTCFIYRMYV